MALANKRSEVFTEKICADFDIVLITLYYNSCLHCVHIVLRAESRQDFKMYGRARHGGTRLLIPALEEAEAGGTM